MWDIISKAEYSTQIASFPGPAQLSVASSIVKWREAGIFSPDYMLNVRCVTRVVSYLLTWLFPLFWVQCAHAQLNPSFLSLTSLTWEKIPGPLPLYHTGSNGKKAGWGLGTRLAHRFVALVGNFFTLLHSKKMLVVAISFVQSNYMQFCKPFHQSIYCWGFSRLFVHAVVSVHRMIQNATMVKSVQQIKC